MDRDPRYQQERARSDRQEAARPERPVPAEEKRRESTPADKPSQAEGERDS